MSSANNININIDIDIDMGKEPENKLPITDNICINELADQIANIIKSPNKNDFIKKYNKAHSQIKKVDEILYKPSTLEPTLDIKVLFEMLKEYDTLLTTGNISVIDYKNMCDLVILIEGKLKNSFLDVKEIQ